ncbi:hypothetical protein NP233_g12379 [Leucocoprinus birnbaumii]|uniref:Uncharacterized protein n=1 Tax=Leucocoprinus birnbaumii TaxID=56174 RepID=A0AAD5VF70_9AGAR|nr:hypothetical protein NP233_g12379 [Leucocoprinus birnbaumii]
MTYDTRRFPWPIEVEEVNDDQELVPGRLLRPAVPSATPVMRYSTSTMSSSATPGIDQSTRHLALILTAGSNDVDDALFTTAYIIRLEN